MKYFLMIKKICYFYLIYIKQNKLDRNNLKIFKLKIPGVMDRKVNKKPY